MPIIWSGENVVQERRSQDIEVADVLDSLVPGVDFLGWVPRCAVKEAGQVGRRIGYGFAMCLQSCEYG